VTAFIFAVTDQSDKTFQAGRRSTGSERVEFILYFPFEIMGSLSSREYNMQNI
jgi:hypothetical protein